MWVTCDEGCAVEEAKAEVEHGGGVNDRAVVGRKEGVVEEGGVGGVTSSRGGKGCVGVGEAAAEEVGPVVRVADGIVGERFMGAFREATVSELVRVDVEEVEVADGVSGGAGVFVEFS